MGFRNKNDDNFDVSSSATLQFPPKEFDEKLANAGVSRDARYTIFGRNVVFSTDYTGKTIITVSSKFAKNHMSEKYFPQLNQAFGEWEIEVKKDGKELARFLSAG